MSSCLAVSAEGTTGAGGVSTLRNAPAPRTVLAIASLGAAVAFIDATIVNIAFPNIRESFRGTSISSLSWILNAYNIVFAAFLLAAGRIADLVGRRRIFVLGLELFTFASLLCALAPSPAALIAFRVLQAFGAACLVPSSLAIVLNAFPPERRSHGVALLSAVGAGAAGIGPSLGGLLIAADDWRLVFIVNIPIGIAAIVLARGRLVESRAPGRRRLPDLLGALTFAIAMGALVLGVVQGQSWGWGSAQIIVSFALALILGAFFVARCRRHRAPIIDLSLLRSRTFADANAMTVVGAAGFYAYTLSNVLFLTGVWRYSVLQAGLALTPGPLVAMAIAGPTSRLVQRFGHRPILFAGGLIWGGAVLWLVERMGPHRDFLGTWLPGVVWLGVGAGTLFPNLSGAAVASAPGESFATATGLNSVARQLGAAVGVAVAVALIGTPPGLVAAVAAFHHAWTFGAVCLIAAGVGSLGVGRLAVDRTPALAEAARAVMRAAAVGVAAPAPAPRTRRKIAAAAGDQHAPHVQTTVDFLAAVPIFAGLEPEVLEQLAERAREVTVEAGSWLFHEGEAGDAAYVVRAGRLHVVDEASSSILRELGRGDAVGELALLTDSPRSASVRAIRASELVAIGRAEFEALLHASPALPLALARELATQLRLTRPRVTATRPLPVTVALVALDRGVPLDDLAHGLHEAVCAHAAVELLDGGDLPAVDSQSQASAVYGPALDHSEAASELVLLAAGALEQATPWTEFCLQQADRILAFTSGQVAIERHAERAELRGCDLVAYGVRAGTGALGGIADALDPIESHLLAPATLAEDLARMGRRLCGRSVGIVLSGGGARGFAHIGVLDELLAAGVKIDRVAGVSMGAVIGALFAMGLEPATIDAICFDEWVQRRPLADYTLPRHALIRGERIRAMLRRQFGEMLIEELPRSFMCGYAELRSGRLLLARHGPLWENVGFSICLPVIGPPQVRGRDIYIDGSFVDNLPVEAVAEMHEGPIIAVDVRASFGEPEGRRNGRLPGSTGRGAGGEEPARDRAATERLPSLAETLTRVMLLGSSNTSEAARRHADLVIRPRPDGVGLFEFHQLDAALEAGRIAARQVLEDPPAWLLGGARELRTPESGRGRTPGPAEAPEFA